MGLSRNQTKRRETFADSPPQLFSDSAKQQGTMECTAKNPADILISALKERNISVKRGEIESALNDETSHAENAKWISEHLSYDTLLTREELTLYVVYLGSAGPELTLL